MSDQESSNVTFLKEIDCKGCGLHMRIKVERWSRLITLGKIQLTYDGN